MKIYTVKTDDNITADMVRYSISRDHSPDVLEVDLFTQRKLYKCPYDNHCACDMSEPCLGCEEFNGKEAEGV